MNVTFATKAVVDSIFCPSLATNDKYFLDFEEKKSVEIDTVVLASLSSQRLEINMTRHKAKYDMTPSTKLEVHNVSQCRQRATELWPQSTQTEIW